MTNVHALNGNRAHYPSARGDHDCTAHVSVSRPTIISCGVLLDLGNIFMSVKTPRSIGRYSKLFNFPARYFLRTEYQPFHRYKRVSHSNRQSVWRIFSRHQRMLQINRVSSPLWKAHLEKKIFRKQKMILIRKFSVLISPTENVITAF